VNVAGPNKYTRIVELLFRRKYRRGTTRVEFTRDEIVSAARKLQITVPKNLGDVIYSVRYRQGMPDAIRKTAPEGQEWIIVSTGKAKHEFRLGRALLIAPNPILAKTKIPDATPGMVAKYALNDEQALLAILRYNRLIDVFSGTACYSLQNHLRTSVKDMGQIETDEVYVGIDRRGAHFVYPVQAKGGRDRINAVQIMQDIGMCAEKFPGLICRPIAAQFLPDNSLALFELRDEPEGIRVVAERHYMLVPPDVVAEDELARYGASSTQ